MGRGRESEGQARHPLWSGVRARRPERPRRKPPVALARLEVASGRRFPFNPNSAVDGRLENEFHRWLFRRYGPGVSRTGSFGDRNRQDFQERLEFSVKVIPYEGDDAWVEPTAREIHELLESAAPPPATAGCEYRGFAKEAVSAG